MTNCVFSKADYRDIQSVNQLADARRKPFGRIAEHFAERYLQRYARDHARTPMQWSDAPNAGFTSGTPWMKVNDNYKQINAADQQKDPRSVFHFYKTAISLRKAYADIVRDGEVLPIGKKDKNVFAFARRLGKEQLLVVCSLSPKAVRFSVPAEFIRGNAQLLLCNTDTPPVLGEVLQLAPCACAVWHTEA